MESKSDVTDLLEKLKLIKALKKSPFLPNIKEVFSIEFISTHKLLESQPILSICFE